MDPEMRYDAVIFDIDHTLLYDGGVEKHVLAELLPQLGEAALEAILKVLRSGPISMREGLRRTLIAYEIEDVDARAVTEAFMRRCLEELPRLATVLPRATETLQALAADGCKTALLTNGWPGLQRKKTALVSFDGPLFISEVMGFWKPDPRLFEQVLSVLGVSCSRALYVGDNPVTDVQGARSAGMDVAWIREDGASYPAGLPRPQYVIDGVAQIRSVIAG